MSSGRIVVPRPVRFTVRRAANPIDSVDEDKCHARISRLGAAEARASSAGTTRRTRSTSAPSCTCHVRLPTHRFLTDVRTTSTSGWALSRPTPEELALPAATTAVYNGARLARRPAPQVLPRPRRSARGALPVGPCRRGVRSAIWRAWKNRAKSPSILVRRPGAAYGTHSLQVPRITDLDAIVRGLTPSPTRPVICGAGRVGREQSRDSRFPRCSRRANQIGEVGLETTFNRPIINTYDEAACKSGSVPPASAETATMFEMWPSCVSERRRRSYCGRSSGNRPALDSSSWLIRCGNLERVASPRRDAR